MGKPKISIIVPIYNTKDCLRNCVSTLLSQSYPHFELLLIDDGSTDGSAAICDEFKAKDNRVKVVHKANGGVSSARNCGLDLAQGDFVCFVDSDDWVEKDYLHDLVRFMDGNVDFVLSDNMYVSGTRPYIPPVPQEVVGDVEILFSDYARLRSCYAPYGKLFRRSIIRQNGVHFETSIHCGEDRLFNFAYLCHVRQVAISPGINYYYCRRKGSLTSKWYDFGQEYFAYRKSYELIKRMIQERKISNPNSIAKLYSVVCDFANRCINVIYHTPNLGYKGRMELLGQLDVQLLGKYMFAINAKEKIIKKLFALRLIPVLDLMRVTRTKTSDIQELGNN